MRGEARLRGRATLLVRAEALPEARGSPCGAMAFSLLRAMGSMIEPRASWVRRARAYRGVRQGAAPLRPSALVHHHECIGGTGVPPGADGGARCIITLGGVQRFFD